MPTTITPVNRRSRGPRFTQQEDNTIFNCIKELGGTNLQEAFKRASESLTNRTPLAVEMRYYYHLKNKGNAVITVGSAKGFTKNQKNVKRVDGVMPEPELHSVHWLASQIFQLNTRDRRILIDFLTLK